MTFIPYPSTAAGIPTGMSPSPCLTGGFTSVPWGGLPGTQQTFQNQIYTSPYVSSTALSNILIIALHEIIFSKVFKDKSEDFKQKLFNTIVQKAEDTFVKALTNSFSSQNIEYFKELTEEEIINYIFLLL